jgi:hypothetical protein
MTLNKPDILPPDIVTEITSLINSPARKQITLDQLIKIKNQSADQKPLPAKELNHDN